MRKSKWSKKPDKIKWLPVPKNSKAEGAARLRFLICELYETLYEVFHHHEIKGLGLELNDRIVRVLKKALSEMRDKEMELLESLRKSLGGL